MGGHDLHVAALALTSGSSSRPALLVLVVERPTAVRSSVLADIQTWGDIATSGVTAGSRARHGLASRGSQDQLVGFQELEPASDGRGLLGKASCTPDR